ncbi:MAG: hypothetical protein KJ749_10940, partial [Planctomycetes bacterium]|nr:hypothetical protein [Planctomycetota bacterium]
PLVEEGAEYNLAFADLDADGWIDAVLLDGTSGNPDYPSAFMNMGGEPIPAVSGWGLIATTLLFLTAGTLVYARRREGRRAVA